MKLINADEVIRDLASLKYSKEYGKVGATYNLAIDDCIGEIKATPTALYAEPVKHGKWIKEKHTIFGREIFTCSNCGNSLDFSGVNAGRGSANYCPHCGARMDGEVERRNNNEQH